MVEALVSGRRPCTDTYNGFWTHWWMYRCMDVYITVCREELKRARTTRALREAPGRPLDIPKMSFQGLLGGLRALRVGLEPSERAAGRIRRLQELSRPPTRPPKRLTWPLVFARALLACHRAHAGAVEFYHIFTDLAATSSPLLAVVFPALGISWCVNCFQYFVLVLADKRLAEVSFFMSLN